jgi:uncharacterized protein YggE
MSRPCVWFLTTFVAVALSTLVRAEEPEPTITVSGSAEVRVVPDQAVITAAVETRAKEVATACKENEASIRNIIKFLKSSGVEDKHISTRYISIEPIMRRRPYSGKAALQAQANDDPFAAAPNDSENPFGSDSAEQLEVPVGYLARRQFAITITDLDKFEEIYCGLVAHGVNRVDGTEFRTSKLREHRDEARLKAVRAAKEKAEAMAGELGAELASVKSIQEMAGVYNSSLAMQNSVSNPFGGYEGGSEEQAVGQITITAAVNVVFYLEDTELDE